MKGSPFSSPVKSAHLLPMKQKRRYTYIHSHTASSFVGAYVKRYTLYTFIQPTTHTALCRTAFPPVKQKQLVGQLVVVPPSTVIIPHCGRAKLLKRASPLPSFWSSLPHRGLFPFLILSSFSLSLSLLLVLPPHIYRHPPPTHSEKVEHEN